MHDSPRSARLSPQSLSVLFGIIITTVVGLFLYTLGLTFLEAAVFGTLGGFTMGAVLYREQNLIRLFEDSRKSLSCELARHEQRLQNIYDHSSCCLVELDAETHAIRKASLGFVRLLGIPPDREVRGEFILDVLHVESMYLVDLFLEVKATSHGGIRKDVEIVDLNGSKLVCDVSAMYYSEAGFIELALSLLPKRREDVSASNKGTHEDFDRFRRGLYRRETRILELKEEVNEILNKHNEKPRYQFDQRTDDSRTPMKPLRETKR